MSNTFKVHPVEWNNEKVGRFWDFLVGYEPYEDTWFSKINGPSIVAFLEKNARLSGKLLDYGIGKGHLANLLLNKKSLSYYACDFSHETANLVNDKLKGFSNFQGCSVVAGFPSSFKDNEFDLILLIESIEHLTDEYLEGTIKEVKRMLKPGGQLIITTPNDEILEQRNVICPDCGCVFHRVQHMRKFTVATLTELTTRLGLKSTFCNAIDFTEYGRRGWMHSSKNMLRAFLGPIKRPHLVYIGTK